MYWSRKGCLLQYFIVCCSFKSCTVVHIKICTHYNYNHCYKNKSKFRERKKKLAELAAFVCSDYETVHHIMNFHWLQCEVSWKPWYTVAYLRNVTYKNGLLIILAALYDTTEWIRILAFTLGAKIKNIMSPVYKYMYVVLYVKWVRKKHTLLVPCRSTQKKGHYGIIRL